MNKQITNYLMISVIFCDIYIFQFEFLFKGEKLKQVNSERLAEVLPTTGVAKALCIPNFRHYCS
jgi:hypothetical protein